MVGYRLALAARRIPRVEHALDRVRRVIGRRIRSDQDWLERFVQTDRSFADIGGMWGIDGEIAIRAAELGASTSTIVDFFTTERFDEQRAARAPRVRMLVGSIEDRDVLAALGPVDRVWCWGVLYHHPAPAAVLAALRTVTADRLLLESRTIPEVPGLPQAAVYWPYLPRRAAERFNHRRFGLSVQGSIDTPYEPGAAGANNFWGMTPSSIVAMARTCGFRCVRIERSPKGPQRHVFELVPEPVPYLFGFGPRSGCP